MKTSIIWLAVLLAAMIAWGVLTEGCARPGTYCEYKRFLAVTDDGKHKISLCAEPVKR